MPPQPRRRRRPPRPRRSSRPRPPSRGSGAPRPGTARRSRRADWGGRVACRRDVTRYAVGLPDIREYADPRLLVELAAEAEGAGWDGLFLWDHLAAPDSEPLATPVADPWVAMAAIAARTERLR